MKKKMANKKMKKEKEKEKEKKHNDGIQRHHHSMCKIAILKI